MILLQNVKMHSQKRLSTFAVLAGQRLRIVPTLLKLTAFSSLIGTSAPTVRTLHINLTGFEVRYRWNADEALK